MKRLSKDILEIIRNGDLSGLKQNLSEDAELWTKKDEDDRGIAHHSVLSKRKDLIAWIIDQPDCPILSVDDGGWNILHLAASIGDTEIASVILCQDQALKLINEKNESGNTPLHYASSKGHLEMVRLLLENGADVLVGNRFHQTPLHRAATLGHVSILRTLVEALPATQRTNLIDAKDSEGNTALHVARQDGQEEAIAALLELGASKDVVNAEGERALII